MSVRLIHGKEFIRATADGQVHVTKSAELLGAIAKAAADLDEAAILVDVRPATGRLTPNELWTLAQELLKHKRVFSNRTAILCQFEKAERARFFALCAEHGGVNIEVFTSYEDAMEWLLG